jgi:bile acid:Na+ symporter, BASS family
MPVWFSVAIQASIMMIVLAIGLQTTWADAVFLFRQPGLLIKSLLARNVAMPVVAILLVKAFPIHPAVKIAIVLLSVTPVPPVLPNALMKADARACYALGLLVSHSVLAVVLVPVTVELINLFFGTQVHFGPLAVSKMIGLAILVPLAAGMALGHFLRASAPKVARLISAAGTILLLSVILPVLVVAWHPLQIFIGNGALIALALFVVGGLAAGHVLGGPYQGDRTALALATASRHPGIAIAIAGANFPSQGKLVAGAVIIYLFLSQLFFIPYKRWRRRAPDENVGAATQPARP